MLEELFGITYIKHLVKVASSFNLARNVSEPAWISKLLAFAPTVVPASETLLPSYFLQILRILKGYQLLRDHSEVLSEGKEATSRQNK